MKRALCIGINDYPGTGMDLACCVKDAQDWAEALISSNFIVTSLLDSDATYLDIINELPLLIGASRYGDTLVITYSGHGTWVPDTNGDEPDGRDEALCPHDVMTAGPLTDDTLFDIFARKKRGVKLIFISDSCHAGTVSRLGFFGSGAPAVVRFMPPEVFLSGRQLKRARSAEALALSHPLPNRTSALLMAGCGDYEYSYEGDGNGVFTRAAIDHMSEGLRYRDWMARIALSLPSQRYPQTPTLFGTSAQKKWMVFE